MAFIVERDLLTNASDFFKAAFQGGFKEGRDREMTLEDTDPEVFRSVVTYLYDTGICDHSFVSLKSPTYVELSNSLCIQPNCSGHAWPPATDEEDEYVQDEEDEATKEVSWDYLASSLYVFAKTYLVNGLVLATLDGWFERFQRDFEFPTAATVTRVFENVPDDSSLCVLLVDTFVRRVLSGCYFIEPDADGLDQMPVGFTTAVQKAFDSRLDELENETSHRLRIARKFSQSIAPAEHRNGEKTWTEILEARVEASEAAASMAAKIADQTVEIDKLKKEIEELKRAAKKRPRKE